MTTALRKTTCEQIQRIAKSLAIKQGGICPLCKVQLDMTSSGRASHWVVDHDHNTGEIRGVLCRACNGSEGRINNIVMKWGKQGNNPIAIRNWLKSLVDYLDTAEPTGMMYYSHKVKAAKDDRTKATAARQNARAAVRKAQRTTQRNTDRKKQDD